MPAAHLARRPLRAPRGRRPERVGCGVVHGAGDDGHATDAQLAGFLIALRVKGETVDEIVGFRDAVLEHAVPLPVDPMALDIVGTGGDRFGTVNVSTMASVIAAASGVPSSSTATGGQLGLGFVRRAGRPRLDLTLPADRVAEVLGEAGITFAFAGRSTRDSSTPGRCAPARRADGVQLPRPALQPARPEASAVGVAHLDRVPLIVGVFQTRGATASSSAATTARRARRPGTATSGRSRAARSRSTTSTPRARHPACDASTSCRRRRPAQRRDRARVFAGERGRSATSWC